MKNNILFLGPLYLRECEVNIKDNSIKNISNAPNILQWNLIDGLASLVGERLKIINVLPVGIWKKEYSQLWLSEKEWKSGDISGHEIGGINLPFIKQFMRAQKTKKVLKKYLSEETEIIIYSAYMPFLKAVYRAPQTAKITAIITDLPEFYDLGQTSYVRKILRLVQNRMIYKYLERVDRFVVLTEQMYEPLRIGKRPWIRLEGICRIEQVEPQISKEKKIIFYSGTLHYQYGINNLLNAFKNIEDEDIELWICGSGEAANDILALAEEDRRIRFFGFCTQEEVAKIRQQATVLVNPRMNEGEYTKYSFPSKTMEYMASGKPIVMYKLDGIPEEYDKYLNYITGDTISEFSKMLLDACYDVEGIYRQRAENAARFVVSEKNPDKQVMRLLELLER